MRADAVVAGSLLWTMDVGSSLEAGAEVVLREILVEFGMLAETVAVAAKLFGSSARFFVVFENLFGSRGRIR